MNLPIFLVGFMAAGKSSKGKKLASKLNVPFIDLDIEIERKLESEIPVIFNEKGEEYFRKIEAQTLRQFSKTIPAVIAVGGGTPCFNNNMAYMNHFGTTVYLKRAESRLLGRLRQSKQKRPLVSNLNDDELKEFITRSMAQRSSYYEQATIVFNADESTIKDLIMELQDLSKNVK